MQGLAGVTVAVLGGDQREVVLVERLLAEGARVKLAGYPEMPILAKAERYERLVDAVREADAVVAPMSNTNAEGVIHARLDPTQELTFDESVFAEMGRNGAPLFIGVAKPIIKRLAAKYAVHLVQTAEVDAIAIANSIPTAEGAVAKAMAELPITVHGSKAIIVGFGRCGITLGRLLHGMGASVWVAARSAAQRARADEMGLKSLTLDQLTKVVHQADVVYNTVPALVIDRSVLAKMREDALVIDIASAPGGTDFAAAEALGIRAYLEQGIPGRVAPRTAGLILADALCALIAELAAGTSKPRVHPGLGDDLLS